jgi:hypothetical protein
MENSNAYWASVGTPKGSDHFKNLGQDGRIILKRILKKRTGGRGIDSSCSRQGQVVVCCEDINTVV